MKKIAFVAAAAVLFAAPAFAGSAVIEFAVDGGETSTVTIDESSKWDEAALTLCGDQDGAEVCVTFDHKMEAAGDTAGFTTTDGKHGTAKMVSRSE